MTCDVNSIQEKRMPDGILFDFSDTLLQEDFNALRGNAHLLRHARNPHGYTVKEVQAAADELNQKLRLGLSK